MLFAALSARGVCTQAARGADLELLNRQASMLISHHRIVMRSNRDVGRYLVCQSASQPVITHPDHGA